MAVTFTNNPNKLATPPEGTKVASDSVTGVQYQIVKLDVGGLGSSVPLGSDVDGRAYVLAAMTGFRASDSTYQPLRLDKATNSIQTIEYEHHEIHAGSHFFVVGYQDLTINQVLDFTWQMPNTASWIHWVWSIETESAFLWQVYEGVTATNPLANAITPRNNNRNSATVSGTTMKYEIQANLVAANADTSVVGATLLESGKVGAGKTAGDSIRAHELILDQGALYCLRATAVAAGYINFSMHWYEHTDIA
jgi:hypothetical protein